jgi:putative transcriptional regulator
MGVLFNKLKKGLEDAIAYESGEKTKAVRVRSRQSLEVDTPKLKGRVEDVRLKLNLSQENFAKVLNVSKETVAKWEQGVNTPSGASMRLLEIIQNHPELTQEIAH